MSRPQADIALDYERVSRVIDFLEAHVEQQPDLTQVAAAAGLSPEHFQRIFKRWVGISPKKYLQSLTLNRAQNELKRGSSLLSAALKSGLSGTGRLHDLFVTFHGMTPGEYQALGRSLRINYGIVPSPFGHCLLGVTDRGVCWLSFGSARLSRELPELRATWPGAEFLHNSRAVERVARSIFPGNGKLPKEPIHVLVKGSEFQLRVWRALLQIPIGSVTSYGELAAAIDKPNAMRALGTAVGQNAISFLIPCHRVIRAGGHFGQYRWGAERKAIILEWEAVASAPSPRP
ncbi:MAG: methylated-DNA--[protein]-cysteine S-methyltransferase [Gammaproteobacteria bacterium]|nr:methylated-DNA--[protein]-cysteine S-methyltransferase [Gammaproteobacteria bacterium]